MFAVFVSGSGVDGFYSILAVSGFYRFARVRAAFAFLLPCAGFGCAPAVLRRSSGVSGNGAFGCLMVIQDVSRFSFG